MPSEAVREALQGLAAEVLGEELLDDRFQADGATPACNSFHRSGCADGSDLSDLSDLSDSDPWGSEQCGGGPRTRRRPSAEERAAQGASLLAQIVDVFVGARRLSGWCLWLQLAAAAHLVNRWQSSPPIVDGALPDLAELRERGSAAGALARRLWRVVDELEIWGPVDTSDLAEEFVAAEISAAAGLSHYGSRNVVDAARVLFMTDRLPRTRQLLRAGLLDWTKLRTITSTTQLLDDVVCKLVEAAVITDADLVLADPLDTLADPACPGRDLPAVARLNNPSLQAALTEAIAAIDAQAAARRAAKARRERYVAGKPLPDAMGRLEITAGQEEVAAVLVGLDHAVAAAKHAGDTRTADQIRTDHAIHLLTEGAHGTDAYLRGDADDADDAADAADAVDPEEHPDGEVHEGDLSAENAAATPGARRRSRRKALRRYGRRGLQVRLTIPLATWLDLAEDPAVLDGYGPVPAALARQIAAEAARDHPTTTTWRCVVVHDRHGTVLGVGDVVPTPRYTPTDRQKTFVRTADTYCIFPGCRAQAWHCDIDHRRPYDHDNPAAGGPTCTCNLHSLCRRHHRLKTAGLITPVLPGTDRSQCGGDEAAGRHECTRHGNQDRPPVLGELPSDVPGAVPPGSIEWRTWTGRRYSYQPPRPTPAPTDPEIVAACATLTDRADRADRAAERDAEPTPWPDSQDSALTHWDRARLKLLERQAAREARRARRGARDRTEWENLEPDAAPPF